MCQVACSSSRPRDLWQRIQRGVMNVTGTRLQHTGCESAVCVCAHVYAAPGGAVCGCYKQCE